MRRPHPSNPGRDDGRASDPGQGDGRAVGPGQDDGRAAAPERLRPFRVFVLFCDSMSQVSRCQSTRTAPVGGSYDSGFSATPVEGFCAPTNMPSPTYTATWYALPALPQYRMSPG